MTLLVFGFFSIMLATFALVIAFTRQTPLQNSIERRMALIQPEARSTATVPDGTIQLFKTSTSGRFGSLEEVLKHYQLGRTLQLYILQADSSANISNQILISAGLCLAGYTGTWILVPIPLIDISCGFAMALLPFGILAIKRTRRINAFNAVLPESIDMLARALRAGYSMVGAIEMLSQNAQKPAAAEFGEVFKQQNLGLPLRDALMQLLDRVPSLDLRVLVTAILVQKDTGGNLVEILDRTVVVIRERLRIQGEIRVHTAQGRLTGWILSALPIVMLTLVNIVNPGYSSILFHDPFGRKLIYGCVGMLATGTIVIHRIVNGIEV
jgi:tight adherence protein B